MLLYALLKQWVIVNRAFENNIDFFFNTSAILERSWSLRKTFPEPDARRVKFLSIFISWDCFLMLSLYIFEVKFAHVTDMLEKMLNTNLSIPASSTRQPSSDRIRALWEGFLFANYPAVFFYFSFLYLLWKEQGNYSLRRPPKLTIPQAVIGQRWATVNSNLYKQTCMYVCMTHIPTLTPSYG